MRDLICDIIVREVQNCDMRHLT